MGWVSGEGVYMLTLATVDCKNNKTVFVVKQLSVGIITYVRVCILLINGHVYCTHTPYLAHTNRPQSRSYT